MSFLNILESELEFIRIRLQRIDLKMKERNLLLNRQNEIENYIKDNLGK